MPDPGTLDLDRMRRERVGKVRAELERLDVAAAYLLTSGNVLYAGGQWMLAADNGLLFLATGGATFTLPAKQNGLAFRFVQTVDANLVIQGAGDIVHKNSAGATTVTFSTAGEKLGSHVLVECLYTATGVLKWLVSNLGGTTASVEELVGTEGSGEPPRGSKKFPRGLKQLVGRKYWPALR